MLSRTMDGFQPLARLQRDMNRLFEGFFEDTPADRPYARGYPAMNVWEDGECAYVEAELPGLSMENIEVLVSGNELTLKGRRRSAEQKDAAWHRRERAQGDFARTVALPWEIDADKCEARLTDGVLTLRLPKSEAAKPKKVKVLTA